MDVWQALGLVVIGVIITVLLYAISRLAIADELDARAKRDNSK